MTNTNNQNGTVKPAPAASAARQNTDAAGNELSPRDILSNALQSAFEAQGAGTTLEEPAPAETGEQTQAEETEQTETEQTETTEQTEAEATEQSEAETTEAETQTTEEEDEPAGVKKRIGKLLGRIEELEKKLADRDQRPEVRDQTQGQLSEVHDPAELDRREQQIEVGLEEVDTLIGRLGTNPARVEQYLRQNGVKLQDESGDEDYSAERMGDWLANVRSRFRQTLRAIPQRRKFLAEYEQHHAAIVKMKPWVGDKTDERQAMLHGMAQKFPALKGVPNWEYWVACAVEGHLATQKTLRAGNVPKKPAARPGTGAGGGSAPRQQRPETVKLNEAKARVQKEGSRGALSNLLSSSGFVKER